MNCLVTMASGLLLVAARAEPELHLPGLRVAQRISPPSFTVEDYRGTLNWGYQRIHFRAPGGELRWNAWTDPQHVAIAHEAMRLVENRALANESCNHFFSERMPRGRTFAELWNGHGARRIRVSFSPGPSGTWRAATYGDSAPYEWTITETAVMMGPESVASAMVHEATRTNGVGPEYAIAQAAERICGMSSFLITEALLRRLGWRILRNQPAY